MLKSSRDFEEKTSFFKSMFRYVKRRIAAWKKPVDEDFFLEYNKFRRSPEDYTLHGEQYVTNYRKTMGKVGRSNKVSYLGGLILEYKKDIPGLRVFNSKIYFNGEKIYHATAHFRFDNSIVERFIDFCFFYVEVNVKEQEKLDLAKREERFARILKKLKVDK